MEIPSPTDNKPILNNYFDNRILSDEKKSDYNIT